MSPRSMPAELAEHSYGKGFEARSVRQDGSMKWDGKFVFVGILRKTSIFPKSNMKHRFRFRYKVISKIKIIIRYICNSFEN